MLTDSKLLMKTLTRFLLIVSILFAVLGGPPPALAQALNSKYFAVSHAMSTAGVTHAFVVIPARGGAVPVVTAWSVVTDIADAGKRLAVFSNAPPIVLTGGQQGNAQVSAGATAGVGTNGFAVGDVALIEHSNGLTERVILGVVTVTNIAFAQTPTYTNTYANARLFRCNTNATFIAVTNMVSGSGIIGGIAVGQPMLIEINGTSACRFNAAAGFYDYNTR